MKKKSLGTNIDGGTEGRRFPRADTERVGMSPLAEILNPPLRVFTFCQTANPVLTVVNGSLGLNRKYILCMLVI